MAETIGALTAASVASSAAASGTAAAAVAGSSFAAGAASTAGFGAATAAASGAGLFSAGNLALGSTLLSGVMSVASGFQQASGYRAQAAMMANDAEETKRAALVEEQLRLKRLNSMMSTNMALAASKGYDASSSPSFGAIQDDTQSEGLADINQAKLNQFNRAYRMQWQSDVYDSQGTGAIIGGIASAGGSLMRYAVAQR